MPRHCDLVWHLARHVGQSFGLHPAKGAIVVRERRHRDLGRRGTQTTVKGRTNILGDALEGCGFLRRHFGTVRRAQAYKRIEAA